MLEKRCNIEHKFYILAFLVIVLIISGVLIFKKPTVTGKVILGKETVYRENLNLKLNESGTYEWQPKNPGKIKSLTVTGSASLNGTARVYIERNGTRQLIFDSTKQLFDVDINVLPEYKKILQGDKILVQNLLFNLRGFGGGNVDVKYAIKDSKGNLIAAQEETVFIETQAKFIRELVIPAEIKPGTYVAFVEASANGTIVGAGSDTFEVTAKYEYKPELRYYLIGLAVLVGAVILIILSVYGHGLMKKKKQIAELKEKKPQEKIEKLEKELKALEEGYASKFISEESYKKEKARIEAELIKLRK